ncbi:MAG: IMP cyclohydrolase [Treponema sp.]|nr:IMP cyclohydrolase [Treponema sp.]
MNCASLVETLKQNEYHGRGIVFGMSEDGTCAVIAYFIMGRSENSRNRIFVAEGDGIRTQAFDESKMTDARLIIYAPVRVLGTATIVTNGDQTDTVYDGLRKRLTFEQSLRSRTFEPDAPHFTPRISGVVYVADGLCSYALSIIKNDGSGACNRFTFAYEHPVSAQGRFIHTYAGNGNPLPSFEGEPVLVDIRGDIDSFTHLVWENLHSENKVSLFTRFIELNTGKTQSRIINRHSLGASEAAVLNSY